MVAAMLLMAAAGEAMPPPPTLRGPYYACRMTDPAGETFNVAGQLGEGRRINSPNHMAQPQWSYDYAAARIEDSQAGFAGPPIDAWSSPRIDNIRIIVRYAAGRNGRRISIGEGGHARLTEDNSGNVLADGLCRLTYAPAMAMTGKASRYSKFHRLGMLPW